MKTTATEATFLPSSPASEGGITIHNRLHPGHRYQAGVEEVLRIALRDLPGPWDVSVYPVGRPWFRIDVVAPDGASWSAWVPVHEGPRVEELADTVRAACVRRGRLRPENGKRRAGNLADGSDKDRDGGRKAPEGMPK